jgi:hypothetical protein
MPKLSLHAVISAQPRWFSAENKRFFGDRSYDVAKSASGKPFLIRSTYAWTDMFGGTKRLHYRLNPLDPETLEIQHLIDQEFADRNEVNEWLQEN